MPRRDSSCDFGFAIVDRRARLSRRPGPTSLLSGLLLDLIPPVQVDLISHVFELDRVLQTFWQSEPSRVIAKKLLPMIAGREDASLFGRLEESVVEEPLHRVSLFRVVDCHG